MNRSGTPSDTTRARRGISLVEVMVSMTLLAVMAVSHTALTERFAQRQRSVSLGAYRAAELSELAGKFIAIPFDSLPARAGCVTVSATAQLPFGYTRCVSVTDVGATQRRVLITLTPAALTRVDTMVIRRAKNNAVGAFGL